MPQVDLSTVCGGGSGVGGGPDNSKVACETLADAAVYDTLITVDAPPTPVQLDYAPESFWLSKDAELDWLDRNAYIERKDSGKGSQQSYSTNLNPGVNPVHITASSNRFSGNVKSKASIIGLPKPTKPNYAEAKNRRHSRAGSIRLFPKRSGSVGNKTGTAPSEPSSPKVSCMGRVRSKKDRSKRGKNRKKANEPGLVRNKSVKVSKTGFWKNIRAIFRPKGKENKGGEPEWETVVDANKRSNSKKKRGFMVNTMDNNNTSGGGDCSGEVCSVGSVETPGLGGVKRFASGRRSDAWAEDLEVVEVGKSEPLDKGPIWRRREGGPQPVNVGVDRDWQSVGPASV